MAHQSNGEVHSEDLQDIIAKPPSWLLKRGIGLVFFTLISILIYSSMINYPDIVRTSLKINAVDGPKVVVNKVGGNLVKLLVKDGQNSKKGDVLAFMESTADHKQVLLLLDDLTKLSGDHRTDHQIRLEAPSFLKLGELQSSYQTFYQSYLTYKASLDKGIYAKNRGYILKNIKNLSEQNAKIIERKTIQTQELELSRKEIERYRILDEKKVISKAELEQKEIAYLNKQYPLNMTANMILDNKASIDARNQKLAELDNQIEEEKSKFIQALNSLISEIDSWKKSYVLTAPASGKLVFASSSQENQYIEPNREVFFVIPEKASYYGEMYIPQSSIGKTKVGQKVLVKVKSYPFQEYGYLEGNISTISDMPLRDSVFFSKVTLLKNKNPRMKLKIGMVADAEILTEEMSIFQRIKKSIFTSLKF